MAQNLFHFSMECRRRVREPYASCWFKVHHPAEFYAGLINSQPMGFYSVNTLYQDAKRHGIRILPVSWMSSAEQT